MIRTPRAHGALFLAPLTIAVMSGSAWGHVGGSTRLFTGWSIALVSAMPTEAPPTASNGTSQTLPDTPTDITLVATDDNLPSPPAALTYIITALPTNGSLSVPGGAAITTVPFNLPANGKVVRYTPNTGYTGSDTFKFRANDGGTPTTGGDSNEATVTVLICTSPATPTGAQANPPGVCANQSTVLSATVGAGDTVVWYTGSCGGTTVTGGATPTVTPLVTTTYFARARNTTTTCVSDACASVVVQVSGKPNTPTNIKATPSLICAGQSSLLSATVLAGEEVSWFASGCGEIPIGNGPTLSVSPGQTTTYFARARNIATGCPSTSCASVILPVNGTPQAPSAPSPANNATGQSASVSLTWTPTGTTPVPGPSSTEVVANSTGSSTNSADAVGNFFAASSTVSLTRIEMWLTINSSTALRYFVYESNTQEGTYNRILDVPIASSGSGTLFYSSGTINVTLISGRFYYIGVGWQGAATYYFANSLSTLSFGQQISGMHNQFPPPATASFSAATVGYNQRLTTNPVCPSRYNVYLDTVSPPVALACQDILTTTCQPQGGLQAGQTYFWRVAVDTCCGSISGPIWSFSTCAAPNTPTNAAANPPALCTGGSSTLSATVGAGETVNWYTGSCGGTSIGTGTSFSVAPSLTTTYYARARNNTTNCVSANCATVVLTVGVKPGTPTGVIATPATICGGQSAVLSGTVGAGEELDWYIGSCGEIVAGTGTSLNVSPNVATTYYARARSAGSTCTSTACASVAVTVNAGPPTPGNPTPANAASNLQPTVTLSWQATGSGVAGPSEQPKDDPMSLSRTQSDASSGKGQASAAAIASEPGIHATESLATDTVGSNTSSSTTSADGVGNFFTATTTVNLSRIEMWLTISSSTALRYYVYESTTQNGTYNRILDVPIASSGTGTLFYSSGTINVPLVAGRYYYVGVGWQGTSTYYFANSVSAVSFGQQSGGMHASFPPPSSVAYSPATLAYYQRLTTNTVCLTEYDVYLDTSNPPTTPICQDLSVTSCQPPSALDPGQTYFWRVVASTCCGTLEGPVWSFSTCAAASTPGGLAANPPTLCLGGSSTLSATVGVGETVNWYTGSCGGTQVGTGTSINVAPSVTTTYYARSRNLTSSCTGTNCAMLVLTVGTRPNAPVNVGAAPASICGGQSATLSATVGQGEDVDWYTGSCGGATAGTGTSISVSPTQSTTYYARARSSATGCTSSSCTTVTVNVNATSPAASNPTPADGANVLNFTGPLTWQATGGGGPSGSPVTEIVGSNVSSSSSTADAIGNFYAASSTVSLTRIEMWMTISSSTALRYFVYESTTPNGTYNRILDTPIASSGTGTGWFNSGLVSVTLLSGRYYYIGVGWQSSSTYYFSNSLSPVSFGQQSGGMHAAFPPPASLPSNSSTVTYYQRLTSTPTCLVQYDVYLDTVNPPVTQVCQGLQTASCALAPPPQGGLLYYWRVVTTSCCGPVQGPVWSFSICAPPATPANVAATPQTVCTGGSSTLSATVGAGETVDWYTGSCGGTQVGTGTSISVSPASNTTYYARARNIAFSCTSANCASVSVSLNSSPSLPADVKANPAAICSGQSASLSARVGLGWELEWFTGNCGGTSVGGGSTLLVSPTQSTIYYVRTRNPSNGCISACEYVSVHVDQAPDAPSGPGPTDGAAGVPVNALLTWPGLGDSPSVRSEVVGDSLGSGTTTANGSGDFYSISTTAKLKQIEMWLSINSSTALQYFIYESGDPYGTYTRILSVPIQSSGTGTRWYSSGPIDVTLTAGKNYFIGVCWQGQATYYYGFYGNNPKPVSFGQQNFGMTLAYPPANTTPWTGATAVYYQRLTTSFSIPEKYKVYLDNVLICNDVTLRQCQPPAPLQTDHVYEWYVTASNACGTTPGPSWSFSTGVAQHLVSAASRRIHGAAGPFDLNCPLNGAAAVDPRRQGAGAAVVLAFESPPEAVDGTLSCNEFTITNGVCDGVTPAGNLVTVALSGLTKNSCLTVALNGVKSLVGTDHVSVVLREGDVDGNGSANIIDLQKIKTNLAKPAGQGTFMFDVDVSGGINILDLQAAKLNLNQPATCP